MQALFGDRNIVFVCYTHARGGQTSAVYKQDEIELRSQLISNRKSYMGFMQNSMTLNDLEGLEFICNHSGNY